MDEPMMRSVLNVAPSVVSIIIRSGDDILSSGSGIIICCNQTDDGLYHSTILSSASLLLPEINEIAVNVYCRDGKLFTGMIITHDRHYNVLFVSIVSENMLAAANISRLEDSLDINPNASVGFLRPHRRPNVYNICDGDTLAVIGRHHEAPYQLMAAACQLSIRRCNLDCNELFRLNCKIDNDGIGGPVISKDGEVIGIAFCASSYTPFLPSNIALGWWNRHMENEGLCQAELGIKIANLYTADIEVIDDLNEKFPNVFKGVITRKVRVGSLGYRIGLRDEDVIVEWSGNTVGSVLELFELAWGHVGESADLVVIRPSEGVCLNLSVVLAERGPHEMNRWLVPEEQNSTKSSCRRRVKWKPLRYNISFV